jgi:2'-phosphotransferase
MRSSSEVLIFIDLTRAIKAGICFYLSSNGVVLTPGNKKGFLEPRFFSRVQLKDGGPVPGWEGPIRDEMAESEESVTHRSPPEGVAESVSASASVKGSSPKLTESGEMTTNKIS